MTYRDQLILDHMPQVHLLASRLFRKCPSTVELDDLISAATVGLIQAVDRFDEKRGLKLKTLAEHRIRGAMLDFLRSLDPLPRAVRQFARRRDQLSAVLQGSLGRQPLESELADALQLSIEKYRALSWTVQASSLISLDQIRNH